MSDWDDIFDDNENPQTIILNELHRSNEFFQILSETLNNRSFQRQARKAIKNLNDIEEYILDCDIYQLKELLARMNGF